MNIGIFGGAFNPVHNGHLMLIDVLSRAPMKPEYKSLDKFIIIPTANPPHRSGADFADSKHRVKMLRLALKDNEIFNPKVSYNKLEISDIEFQLEGKSYTYNTIITLKNLYPTDNFYLFMGSDQLLNFNSWYNYKKIMKMVRIVGFSRCKEDNERLKRFIETSDVKADLVLTEPFEVSSSDIREMINNGESVSGLIPSSVEAYIKENGLYV